MIENEIYIHENGDVKKAINYWGNLLGCEKDRFKVYFKRPKVNTRRKNIGEKYFGLLRIRVHKSSVLNRRIAAWVDHICNHLLGGSEMVSREALNL